MKPAMQNKAMQHAQRGVASIEFALGFFAFFMMCLTWMEIGYMAHVSSVTDVAIAEAAREAKLTSMEHPSKGEASSSGEFMQVFKQTLAEQTAGYGGLVDASKFRFTVQYLKSIEELGNYTGQCRAADDESIELECGEPKFSAIAVYAVEYDYQPMLSGFIAEPGMLRREVIVVQEYERDAFDF
ncbi:MAG: pilus assembly protein [Shewanella sp.]|nr:pilus assembly protein [Shewanella sp.]MCF1430163.1 pilus assembly protein [Shewanella sp.]MCF1456241.1 pilus assembly protein [Shewanella sp.]